MRSATLSAILLSMALSVISTTASAQQSRVEPSGKLFFEGDMVRGRLEGQVGPFCVLQSRFRHGEGIVWRVRALRPDGSVADNTVLKSVVVELGNGDTVALEYSAHGDPPTDYFWANMWVVPPHYPTGTLGYKIKATLQDGSVVTWEPFMRPPSLLAIVEGELAMQAPAQ
jgi:hypothetical protein